MFDGVCEVDCSGKSLTVGSEKYCGPTCQSIAQQSEHDVYLVTSSGTCSSQTCSGIYVAVNTENYCGTSCIDVGKQSGVVVYLQGGTCV